MENHSGDSSEDPGFQNEVPGDKEQAGVVCFCFNWRMRTHTDYRIKRNYEPR